MKKIDPATTLERLLGILERSHHDERAVELAELNREVVSGAWERDQAGEEGIAIDAPPRAHLLLQPLREQRR